MEDGDVSKTCGRIRERPDILAQVVVDREGEQIRLMPPAPEHVAYDTRAVANRVAAVGRGDPLVDDHDRDGIRDSGLGTRDSELGDARDQVRNSGLGSTRVLRYPVHCPESQAPQLKG